MMMVVGGRVHTGSFDREMSKCVRLCVSVSISVCRCLALGGQGADVMGVCVSARSHCLASHGSRRRASAAATELRGSEGCCVGVGRRPPSAHCVIRRRSRVAGGNKGQLENYLAACEATTVSVGV